MAHEIIEFKGAKELKAMIEKYKILYPEIVDKAVYKNGERIMAESVKECPIKTKRLRDTGRATPPKNHKVELGYGTDYAAAVHERTELKHDSPTKAKFLKDPLDRAAKTWTKDLAALIKDLIKKKKMR